MLRTPVASTVIDLDRAEAPSGWERAVTLASRSGGLVAYWIDLRCSHFPRITNPAQMLLSQIHTTSEGFIGYCAPPALSWPGSHLCGRKLRIIRVLGAIVPEMETHDGMSFANEGCAEV